MKPLIFTLCVVFAFRSLGAQTPVWQPSLGHTQVLIWPGAAPDAQPVAGPEVATTRTKDHFVGGRPWTYIS
ncbi:MAG: alpha/beta hydrolase, partial [Candidatus Sulfotelmatobacter sp.]